MPKSLRFSEHLIFPNVGTRRPELAGVHDVGRYELDLSGLIQINQTKTSRKPKKIDLTTSPEVRVVVETFFWVGGWINHD